MRTGVPVESCGDGPAIGRLDDYDISVVRGGAAAIARDEWDRLACRGFHRHAWFVAAEACGRNPYHVAVRRHGELVAVFPAYLQGPALHGDLHARWLGPAAPLVSKLGMRLRPSLAVVLPLATSSQPLGAGAELPEQVLEDVFDRLERQAREIGARTISWPFLTAREAPLVRIARRRGYAEAFAGSSASLDLEWAGMDGYLASRGRGSRRTIRKELQILREARTRASWRSDFTEMAMPMDRLFRSRNGSATDMPEGLLQRLAETESTGVHALLLHRGEDLLSSSVMVEAGGVLEGGLAGYRDDVLGAAAYYMDLVYEPLRRGLERGHKRLELGPAALFPKVLRGATLWSRVGLARGLTASASALLRLLAPLVDRRNRQKERRELAALADTAHRVEVEEGD